MPLWMNPEKCHLVTDWLKEGQAKAGREGSHMEIVPTVRTILIDNPDQVEQAMLGPKSNLALYIGGMGARDKNFYNDYCKRLGYEEAAVRIQDAYLSGDREGAVAAVPDALVNDLYLVGTEDYLADRLEAWKSARDSGGVTGMLIFSYQPRALEFLAEQLL